MTTFFRGVLAAIVQCDHAANDRRLFSRLGLA
jgi:hypothetical protein